MGFVYALFHEIFFYSFLWVLCGNILCLLDFNRNYKYVIFMNIFLVKCKNEQRLTFILKFEHTITWF